MLIWALAAALAAPAGSAFAQQLNLTNTDGSACSQSVQAGQPFTIRASATGLTAPFNPVLGWAIAMDVTGLDKVNQPAVADFTPLPVDFTSVTENIQFPGGAFPTGGVVSYGAFTADAGAAVTGGNINLADLVFTVAPGAMGTIGFTIRTSNADPLKPPASINDIAVSAGPTCTVTISEGPQPPTANAGADVNVAEGGSVGLDGSGSQDRAPPSNLTYSWAIQGGGPGGLTNATTATPTYNAPADVAANTPVTIRLTVTDADCTGACTPNTATDDVIVTVTNTSATFPVANAGADQAVVEGQIVNLDGSGSQDNSGGTANLTYSWATVPPGQGTFTGGTTATPTWTAPAVASTTPFTIRLTVTDPDVSGAGGTDTDDVIITVQNLAITANAGADQSVAEGAAAFALNGLGTDGAAPLGNITFAWSVVSGTGGTLSNANMQVATFTPAADVDCDQQTVLRLTVTDPDLPGGSNTATDDKVVTTTDANDSCPNDSPSANAGPDRTVNEGGSVALSGSGTDNEPPTNITFAWAKVMAGDPGTISNASAAAATFNAPAVDGDRNVIVRLTVTDPDVSIGSNSASDTAQVTIVDANCSGKAPLAITTRPPNATPLEIDLDAVEVGDRAELHGARHNNPCTTSSRLVSRLVYNVVGLDEIEDNLPDFDGFSFFLTIDADGDGTADPGETTLEDICEVIGTQIVCDLSDIGVSGTVSGGLPIGSGGFVDVLLGIRAEESAPKMAAVGFFAAALLGGAGMFLFSLAAPGRARRLAGRGLAAAALLVLVGGAGLTACHGTRGPGGVLTQTLNFRVDLVQVDVNGPADTGLPVQGRDIEVTFTPGAI